MQSQNGGKVAYSDFTLEMVVDQFKLTIRETSALI